LPRRGCNSIPASLSVTSTASLPTVRPSEAAALAISALDCAGMRVASTSSLRFGVMTVAPR
jgi:hypothetical protein